MNLLAPLFEGFSLGTETMLALLPWLALIYYSVALWDGKKFFLVFSGLLFLWIASQFSFIAMGIIIALSLINFGLLRLLQTSPKNAIFWGGIAFNLLVLIVFKYIPTSQLDKPLHLLGIYESIQIIGLSFYVFHVVSVFADIKSSRINEPIGFMTFMSYLLYFPKIITGPLIRYNAFKDEIDKPSISESFVMEGIGMIIIGLVKKAAGDYIALYPLAIYANPSGYNGFDHLFAMYGFALYIFLDFSAYTDMARGISRVFGIELPNNFASPYRSTSMIEFWKRWHITLSTWIRDYLYIPLGGSRRGLGRSYFNVMVTFILSGIWHGVGANFALWGAMHGIGVVVNRFVTSKVKIHYLWGWFFTFHWVSLGWIFFANPIDDALLSLIKIFTDFRWDMIVTVISNNWVWYLATFIGLIYSLWDDKVVVWWSSTFQKIHFILKVIIFWMVLALVLFSHLGAVNVFIYQKF